MESIQVKAHFDGQQLVLDEPCTLPAHVPLVLTIQSAEVLAERAEWKDLALQGLAGAYSDDEPDYSAADIRNE